MPELAKLTGAPVVASFELANNLVASGILDGSKTIAMNKGGTVAPLGPGIKVHMVAADHSSSLDLSGDQGRQPQECGNSMAVQRSDT